MWFYTRLAWLSLPWDERENANAEGEMRVEHYIIEAKEVKSAVAKAERILSIGEHTDGTAANDDGEKISVRQVGILVIEPILDPIVSGACVFDEYGGDFCLKDAQQMVMPEHALERLATFEKENGGFPELDVDFGDDFKDL